MYPTDISAWLEKQRAVISAPHSRWGGIDVSRLEEAVAIIEHLLAGERERAPAPQVTLMIGINSLLITVDTPSIGARYRYRLRQTAPDAPDMVWEGDDACLQLHGSNTPATYQIGVTEIGPDGDVSDEGWSTPVTLAPLPARVLTP
jgi:hypothetical protein